MADTHRPGIAPSMVLHSAIVPPPGYVGGGTSASVATTVNRVFTPPPTTTAAAASTPTPTTPVFQPAQTNGQSNKPSATLATPPGVEAIFIPEGAHPAKKQANTAAAPAAWATPGAATPMRRGDSATHAVVGLATPPPRRTAKALSPDDAIVKLPAPLRLAFVPSQLGGLMRCYVLRERSSVLGTNAYRLFHEASGEFLAVARKRNKKQTSSYIIGLDADKLDRDGEECVAKLRASVSGLDFVAVNSNRDDRRELCCVMYNLNPGGVAGARSLRALLPKVLSNGQMEEWRQSSESQWSAIQTAYSKVSPPNLPDDLVVLHSREPMYNEAAKVFQLNFGGRVTCASIKNFQLYDLRDEKKETVIQFGKATEDRFILDFRHPVNVMQAFSMALSAFDGKMMCD